MRDGDILHVRAGEGYAPESDDWLIEHEAFAPDPSPEVPTRCFAVVAATRSVAAPAHPLGGKRPRGRVVTVPEAAVTEWLDEFLQRKGIRVDDLQVTAYRRVPRDRRRSEGAIPQVTFTGTFHPSDALAHAWINGLGRCKNYGCGLILPLTSSHS